MASGKECSVSCQISIERKEMKRRNHMGHTLF